MRGINPIIHPASVAQMDAEYSAAMGGNPTPGSSSKSITDPTSISSMDQEYMAQQAANSNQQKNKPSAPSNLTQLANEKYNPSFGQDILNTGKSAVAGLGEAGQDLLKTIRNIAPNAPVSALGQKLMNYNIKGNMNIPNTVFQNTIQGLFKESPSAALAVLTDGASSLPDIAANVGIQGAMGATLNPNHPISGALENAGGQLGGNLLSILSKATPVMAMKNSVSRLIPFAKNLLNKANEGYNVLSNLGDKYLIEPAQGKLGSFQDFSQIKSPTQAAAHLEAIKSNLQQNYGDISGMQDTINALSPDYKSQVISKINPNTLNGFNKTFEGGAAHSAFQDFAANPTANNAGVTLRALSRARLGKNPDTDAILGNMRDQIKDNIVSPGIGKYASPTQVDKYSLADINYRQFKKFFGDSGPMENLANGNISPNTLDAHSYFNILKSVKDNGAFNSLVPGETTLPMNEYNLMESKIHPTTLPQKLISNNKIANTINSMQSISPLLKSAFYGTIGNSQ